MVNPLFPWLIWTMFSTSSLISFGVPLDLIRCGTRLALAELGKQGTPLQEQLERKFDRLERTSMEDIRS
jgi:hypothetical protein